MVWFQSLFCCLRLQISYLKSTSKVYLHGIFDTESPVNIFLFLCQRVQYTITRYVLQIQFIKMVYQLFHTMQFRVFLRPGKIFLDHILLPVYHTRLFNPFPNS